MKRIKSNFGKGILVGTLDPFWLCSLNANRICYDNLAAGFREYFHLTRVLGIIEFEKWVVLCQIPDISINSFYQMWVKVNSTG